MSLSETEVQNLVEEFLSRQDLKGCRYEFVKANFNDKYPNEYEAVFNVYSPENSLIDGPAVFIVDKSSKKVSIM